MVVGQGAEKSGGSGTQVVPITASAKPYKDGRPAAKYRLDAVDQGRILRHGDGRASAIRSAHGRPLSLNGKAPITCTMTARGRRVGWHALLRARILPTGPRKGRSSLWAQRATWIPARPRRRGCITMASGGTC